MFQRICFVGVDNYRMLKPGSSARPVNGEAVQQVLLAKAFKALGYSVSMVIRSESECINEVVDGIRVITAFQWNAGLPGTRFIYPVSYGVAKALNTADADVYFQSPAGLLTGVTAAFCQWKRKKLIFRVASDVNCIPGAQLIELWRDRKIYEYGLRKADFVSVQSQHQQELLKQHYALDSTIINMAAEIPDESLDCERNIDVLWVSNLRPVKHAEQLLSLARVMPEVSFVMIGGMIRGSESYYRSIVEESAELPNVNFMGQLPYHEVNEIFAKAKILLNTSSVEGFPNTFLQAWARKVPVVSYFDPDNLIEKRGLGHSPSDEADMRQALLHLLNNPDIRRDMGVAARNFTIDNYSPLTAAKKYADLLPS